MCRARFQAAGCTPDIAGLCCSDAHVGGGGTAVRRDEASHDADCVRAANRMSQVTWCLHANCCGKGNCVTEYGHPWFAVTGHLCIELFSTRLHQNISYELRYPTGHHLLACPLIYLHRQFSEQAATTDAHPCQFAAHSN